MSVSYYVIMSNTMYSIRFVRDLPMREKDKSCTTTMITRTQNTSGMFVEAVEQVRTFDCVLKKCYDLWNDVAI